MEESLTPAKVRKIEKVHGLRIFALRKLTYCTGVSKRGLIIDGHTGEHCLSGWFNLPSFHRAADPEVCSTSRPASVALLVLQPAAAGAVIVSTDSGNGRSTKPRQRFLGSPSPLAADQVYLTFALLGRERQGCHGRASATSSGVAGLPMPFRLTREAVAGQFRAWDLR